MEGVLAGGHRPGVQAREAAHPGRSVQARQVARDLPAGGRGAAAPLVLATAWLLVHRQPADTASTCELQTLAGMIGRVTLPDSTVVTLNAKSTLRYPSAFSGDERVVEFEGEGYFKVAKDASRNVSWCGCRAAGA